jgi:hypothetical protein
MKKCNIHLHDIYYSHLRNQIGPEMAVDTLWPIMARVNVAIRNTVDNFLWTFQESRL